MSYLVINADTPAILKKVATYQQACFWAVDLIPAEARAIVAPLERRTFSKFTQLELELLVKATFPDVLGVAPGIAYAALLNLIFDMTVAMSEDPTTFEGVKEPAEEKAPKNAPKPPKTSVKASSKPAVASPIAKRPSGGVTGQVWAMCDKITAGLDVKTFDAADWKGIRATVVTTCTDAGIDPSTAATQYSRWKAAALVN